MSDKIYYVNFDIPASSAKSPLSGLHPFLPFLADDSVKKESDLGAGNVKN